jgi:hypothetical protein
MTSFWRSPARWFSSISGVFEVGQVGELVREGWSWVVLSLGRIFPGR